MELRCDQTPDKQIIVVMTRGRGHERRYQDLEYSERDFGFFKETRAIR
jgi:hypothetical protein